MKLCPFSGQETSVADYTSTTQTSMTAADTIIVIAKSYLTAL